MKLKKHIVFIWIMAAFMLMQAHALVPHDHNMNKSPFTSHITQAKQTGFFNLFLLNLGQDHLKIFSANKTLYLTPFLFTDFTVFTLLTVPQKPKQLVNLPLNHHCKTVCLTHSLPHRAPPLY